MIQLMSTHILRVGMVTLLATGVAACGQQGGGGASEEGDTASGGGGTAANGTARFYEGENLDLVVPYDPGGGYDLYARTLAPYLGECLGAQVIVRNEPGAGSLLATNTTAAADANDRRIQLVNSVGATSAQIAGAEGVLFDMREFSVIGRLATAADTVVVAPDGDLRSFEDFIGSDRPISFAATGPGSNEYIAANVLSVIYDFPIEVVTGFGGSGESRLAVISGDVDAHASTWDSALDAITSGDVRTIVVATDEPVELLPDAPLVTEFEPVAEGGQELLDSLVGLETLGRGLVAPPGLSDAQLTDLREGFQCAADNEDLAEELGEKRPLDVLTGEEYEALLNSVLDSSPEFVAILKESF
jgi:tripartite-type tricarboxylate transporter receptor subunit TctC